MTRIIDWHMADAFAATKDGWPVELDAAMAAAVRHMEPIRQAAISTVTSWILCGVYRNLPDIRNAVKTRDDVDMQILENVFWRGPTRLVTAIPTAKGNANLMMSLSSVISLRIFAKVAIIFLTLRGLTIKFAIINPIS
jgi:hypothetical protein